LRKYICGGYYFEDPTKIQKIHTVYHFTVAAMIVGLFINSGESKPADNVSKYWGYSQVWGMIQSLLFL